MRLLNAAFCLFACGLSIQCGAAQSLTARQIVQQIQQRLGVAIPAKTVDTFKAGDPDTVVTGVAVTMIATFDVLERASAQGCNLVITHEPTFYNHLDTTENLEKQGDAVLAQKKKFIADQHLVVWRFHDGWHARHPDGILLGMTRTLGWKNFQDSSEPHRFSLPPTTLLDLAAELRRKLEISVLRVVGNPSAKVSQVALLPGAAGSARQIALLERGDVEVLIIGETPEWETVEYVADAASEGRPISLILLGHVPSEQAGMQECAQWISSFMAGIPVKFVPASAHFWGLSTSTNLR